MKPEELYNKRILLSPLNWGMGHVSRCIGLVDQLRSQNNEVIIACSESQRVVFKEYFDDLTYVLHAPYPFKFGKKGWFSFDLLRQFRRLNRRRRKELVEVAQLVKEHAVDIIISDHRYGFQNELTYSIFVTHQLNLPLLWYEAFIQQIHKKLIKKFNGVWVMDFADSRLSGELSRNTPLFTVDYIGPYSRFQLYSMPNKKDNLTVLVASGPAVYAQQLVDKFADQDAQSKVMLIASDEIETNGLPIIHGWREQDQKMLMANLIISRSGYSTIMDLHYLGVKAELVPTPRQREQEYLAKLYETKKRSTN